MAVHRRKATAKKASAQTLTVMKNDASIRGLVRRSNPKREFELNQSRFEDKHEQPYDDAMLRLEVNAIEDNAP